MKYSHDICLVDCSDTLSSAGLGVVESISSNPLRGVPGNQFDGLNHTINDLRGMSAQKLLKFHDNKLRAQYQSILPLCFRE